MNQSYQKQLVKWTILAFGGGVSITILLVWIAMFTTTINKPVSAGYRCVGVTTIYKKTTTCEYGWQNMSDKFRTRQEK